MGSEANTLEGIYIRSSVHGVHSMSIYRVNEVIAASIQVSTL